MTQNSDFGCLLNAPTAPPDKTSVPTRKRRLTIEFMYLDREVCAPCRLTEQNLDAALMDAAGLLEAIGVEIVLNKIHIQSLEQALALGFSLSPTLRLNGVDIQPDSQESHCASCSAISGISTECRVWLYQGKAYEAPPKAMILEALLEAACHSSGITPSSAPVSDRARDNLKRFFEANREKAIGLRSGEAPGKETPCGAPASAESHACGEWKETAGCCGSLM